jgi:hypothetical protein
MLLCLIAAIGAGHAISCAIKTRRANFVTLSTQSAIVLGGGCGLVEVLSIYLNLAALALFTPFAGLLVRATQAGHRK